MPSSFFACLTPSAPCHLCLRDIEPGTVDMSRARWIVAYPAWFVGSDGGALVTGRGVRLLASACRWMFPRASCSILSLAWARDSSLLRRWLQNLSLAVLSVFRPGGLSARLPQQWCFADFPTAEAKEYIQLVSSDRLRVDMGVPLDGNVVGTLSMAGCLALLWPGVSAKSLVCCVPRCLRSSFICTPNLWN